MREWRKRMEEEGIPKIKIWRNKYNLEIDCLAFADDLAILAEKAGLQKSYEKNYTENLGTKV